MNIFVFIKVLGHGFVSSQVRHSLDHNLSAQGKANLAASLNAASTALGKGDTQGAADALTDIIFSIH